MFKKTTKKKPTEEDLKEEGEMEEDEYLDTEEPEEEEVEKPKENTNDLNFRRVDLKITRCEKAITVNQKYLKQMWSKIQKLEDDFKLFYEGR